MSSSVKPVEQMDRAELEGQVKKYRKLTSELSARLECPVCLTLPRKGPVPCCPRGHLVCAPCHKKMKQQGSGNCPTCRDPMGEAKNLLASVVIENLNHQCDLTGCKELVAYQGLAEHKEKCDYRLVICPGQPSCNVMVPFCEIDSHATHCSGYSNWTPDQNQTHMRFTFPVSLVDKDIGWKTHVIHSDNEVFFFCMKSSGACMHMQVLMKGDQKKCDKFTATISLLNSKLKPVLFSSFNPLPLASTNDDEPHLLVWKKSLAKIWEETAAGKYGFKVRVTVAKDLIDD